MKNFDDFIELLRDNDPEIQSIIHSKFLEKFPKELELSEHEKELIKRIQFGISISQMEIMRLYHEWNQGD